MMRGPSSNVSKVPVHLQVFVIEDNATIRENLIGTLEELTCVHVAGVSSTEADALSWLEQNIEQWDLVIVDLFLKQGKQYAEPVNIHKHTKLLTPSPTTLRST